MWSGDIEPADPATWTDSTTGYIGNTADGTLLVDFDSDLLSDNAYLGNRSGTTGEVTVHGVGSTWTNNERLEIGYYGHGMLNITGGGAVVSARADIGYGHSSTSRVTVAGVGSTWTNSSVFVGLHGDGALNITNGGAASNTYGYIGWYSGSTSEVTVDGTGSRWTNSFGLTVGRDGSGTLNITNGGAISVAGSTTLGRESGSTGTINFGANGGTLTTREIYYGSSSQLQGTGTIDTRGLVSDVDLVFDASHGLSQTFLLNDPGQNITLNLDMSGASGTPGNLGAGYHSNGTLTIRDGITVESRTGRIASMSGSSGQATVDGAGSTWTSTTGITVGYDGNGTLNITNGGVVSCRNSARISSGADSTSVVTVDGDDSTWTGSSHEIGISGHGTLNVTGGGTVSNGAGYIAFSRNSTGVVTVDGAGSTWTSRDDLLVGYSGNGTLSITNGGSVLVGDTTFIAKYGDSTGTIIFGTKDNTLTTGSLAANFSQLTGTGTIHTRGLVSDIDLVFDASQGLRTRTVITSRYLPSVLWCSSNRGTFCVYGY